MVVRRVEVQIVVVDVYRCNPHLVTFEISGKAFVKIVESGLEAFQVILTEGKTV